MKWPSTVSTTLDLTSDSFLLNVVRDGEQWIVSEYETAAYGAGRTLLEAMADFWNALQGLADVVERNQPADRHLQRQADRAAWMLEVGCHKEPQQ